MQDKQSAATISKGTAWLTFNQLIFMGTSYLTYMVLARILGAALFGVYGVVIGLVTVLTMVLITGTQQVVAKFISETPEQAEEIKKKAFQLQLIFAGSITIIYFALSPLIAYLLHDATLMQYIQLSALIILFHSLFSVFMGYFNGLKKFKQQALYTACYHFVRMLLTIGFVFLGYKVFGAITAFVIASFLFFTVCLIFIGFKKEKNELKNSQNKNLNTAKTITTKRFITFTIPIMLSTIVLYLIMNIDLFLIKALSATTTANQLAGYYTAVQTIARIPYFLVAALPVVLFPLVSNTTFRENSEKTKYYMERGIRYTLLIIIPLAAMLAATAKQILPLLYSQEYAVGSTTLFILVFGMALLAFFTLLTTYIASANKPNTAFLLSTITLAITIVLNYILIKKYSIEGAAVATTIALLIGTIIAMIYIYRKYNTCIPINSFAKILYAAIIMYIVAWFIPWKGYLLIGEYGILAAIYLAILYLSKEINDEDKNIMKRFMGI